MGEYAARTALVTGANSGLGLEASAQLAEHGYDPVIITTRSREKGERALAQLRERTGRDVFETVLLDNGRLESVEAAVASLRELGRRVDVVLLNAGMAPPRELTFTEDGIEATVASTLIGHHLLTMRLLESGLLSGSARIVISGSEAARGDVPTFDPINVDGFAVEHFGGDLERAIESLIRMEPPAGYHPANTYATAKLFVAWWAAELAGKLPEGLTVNAVSPGSTPDTNAAKDAPFYMRKIMIPLFKLIPGMSHSVETGAGRYVEVAGYGEDVSGRFFASRPKKMTGPLVDVQMDVLDNQPARRALWNVVSTVSGGVGYPAPAQ